MKRHISIFALLLSAFAAVGLSAFAADSGDVMRLTPIGYRLGEAGAVTTYDSSVVTVTPGDTSTVTPDGTCIVTSNKSVTLTATLNRDYKVVRWQKFDVDPTIRTTADPIEVFGEGNETVSVEFNANVQWMYVTVVVKYDPVRTVKTSVSSFGKGTVSVSPAKTSYQKGETITLTASPVGGYDFVRWNDGFADHVRTLTVVDDIDLMAYIEPKVNRVTFSAGDGAVLGVTEKVVRFGCAYGELPVPVREGWVFTGWKDGSGAMITSESTSPHAIDHTLTAVWEIPPESYIVVFDANGGTGLQTRVEQKFEVGVAQKLRINTFFRQGSVFVGWNQNDKAQEKQFADEQIVQDLAAGGSAMTLFAVWRAEEVAYTVHFDKNAEDATGEMNDQQFAGGEDKPLSGCNFKRTGWTFLGWSTDPKAVEAAYQDRERVQGLTTEKELTLYAVWTRKPVYHVEYMATVSDKESWRSETVERGKEYKLATNEITRIGYSQSGWTNGGKTYARGEEFTAQELAKLAGDGDTIVFVAYMPPIKYTVHFNQNERKLDEWGYSDKELKYDEEYDLSKMAPQNFKPIEGNNIIGWDEDATATKPTYDKSNPKIRNLAYEEGAEVTLYAIWEGKSPTYAVRFNPNGGEGDAYVQDIKCGVETALTPNRFVRTGYGFANWTNAVDSTTYTNCAIVTDLAAEGETNDLWAVWTVKSYEITFDSAGGSAVNVQSNDYGAAITLPTPEREDYAFGGWYEGEDPFNSSTMPARNVKLTAHWSDLNTYTVRFNGNGGTDGTGNSTYVQLFAYDEEKELTSNAFVRTGHAFANWTNATGEVSYADGEKVKNLVPSGIIDLYAAWTAIEYECSFDGQSVGKKKYSEKITPPTGPTKPGYTFKGWTLNGSDVIDFTTFTMPAHDVAFTSKWEENPQPVVDELKKALGFADDDPITVTADPTDCWTKSDGKIELTDDCTLAFAVTGAGCVATIKAEGYKGRSLRYNKGEGWTSTTYPSDNQLEFTIEQGKTFMLEKSETNNSVLEYVSGSCVR